MQNLAVGLTKYRSMICTIRKSRRNAQEEGFVTILKTVLAFLSITISKSRRKKIGENEAKKFLSENKGESVRAFLQYGREKAWKVSAFRQNKARHERTEGEAVSIETGAKRGVFARLPFIGATVPEKRLKATLSDPIALVGNFLIVR